MIKGPATSLSPFMTGKPPFNSLDGILPWLASLGYKGIELPTWDKRCIDLTLAANSPDYCDELSAKVAGYGLHISGLSTIRQGQLLAVPPAYHQQYNQFATESVHHDPIKRMQWAGEQLMLAAKASHNLALDNHITRSGSLLWPFIHSDLVRPDGLAECGFSELGRRWTPILDAFEQYNVDLCFDLHPGADVNDGITFERFLAAVNHHPRANILYDPSHMLLQHMDYLGFIDIYHERIKGFHINDAEYNIDARSGVHGSFQDPLKRPGRLRSPGDGQIDFKGVFSRLNQYHYMGWAVLDWHCCLKHPEDGAREGVAFIRQFLHRKPHKIPEDFDKVTTDSAFNKRLLGLD